MKLFDVLETKTVLTVHRIRANSKEDAIARMSSKDTTKGQVLFEITADDVDFEYSAREVDGN